MKLFKRTEIQMDYCERCDSICSLPCQLAAERERAFLNIVRWGMRLA